MILRTASSRRSDEATLLPREFERSRTALIPRSGQARKRKLETSAASATTRPSSTCSDRSWLIEGSETPQIFRNKPLRRPIGPLHPRRRNRHNQTDAIDLITLAATVVVVLGRQAAIGLGALRLMLRSSVAPRRLPSGTHGGRGDRLPRGNDRELKMSRDHRRRPNNHPQLIA